MKYEILYQNFIEEIQNRIPKNAKISAVLSDILNIEKEAVYRRLRMDVPFTFTEIATVARHFGISLDGLIQTDPMRSRPLQMKLINFIEPHDVDYAMLDLIPHLFKTERNVPDSHMGLSCNTIPQHFYLSDGNLSRLVVFFWAYMSAGLTSVQKYADIVIPRRIREIQVDTHADYRQVKHTSFVFDNKIFRYMVNNIKYFASINYITAEEVARLKESLTGTLEEIERVSIKGCWPDTGNRVQIYVANINFENSYVYYESSNNIMCMLKAFTLNAASTMDRTTLEHVKTWIRSMKRVSTLISESGEKERIMFFDTQRRIIDEL